MIDLKECVNLQIDPRTKVKLMPYIESKARMTLNHYIEALIACLTAQENEKIDSNGDVY